MSILGTEGIVYLVGAGPGDPELITLKGLRLIKTSDVVVYDRLGAPELLKHTRADAELIDVGKKSASHTMPQDKICELLASKAKLGKTVLRLKGGDPLIFGRGSEEARYLVSQNVNFEIVPGITSAAGASSYTGVALTERNKSTSITLVTGHEDPTKPQSTVDWHALAKVGGTLVIYMGMSRISHITKELMAGGLSGSTPVAVIHRATTPEQRELRTTLAQATDDVEKNNFKAPSLIMVGETAANENALSWFASQPLFGKKILVTRSRRQASELSSQITMQGARAIELPTIDIQPAADFGALDDAIKNINEYGMVIFTSVNAVKYFNERLEAYMLDVRVLGNIKIAAVGEVTQKALRGIGLKTDVRPSSFTAEGLLDALTEIDVNQMRILIPRARKAREILPDTLRERGAIVDVVETYNTQVAVMEESSPVLKMIENNELDLITFASSSTVSNFAELVQDKFSAAQKIPIASIGPVTTARARELGFNVVVEPKRATIKDLVAAVNEYYASTKQASLGDSK